MCPGTHAWVLPQPRLPFPSTFMGTSSRHCDSPGGVREGEWLRWEGSGQCFFSPVPAGEGKERLVGGRWHSGVQQWMSLDESQDIIREISRRGE